MPDHEITEAYLVGVDADIISADKLDAATKLAEKVCSTHKRLWASVNPAAVVALFGDKASSLFIHHKQAVEFIMSINPDMIPEEYRAVPEGCSVLFLVSDGVPFLATETPTGTPTGYVEITDNRQPAP